ncbi:MAG: hypothetical protein K5905_27160, partial [Roseibium sp.]|uniref:hypothetical protein n=1 Tax=Roseibium sp. TaxID=1936156 RepID=UPI0026300A3B
SDSASSATVRPPRVETIVIALVCVIVLAAGWYILSQRQQALRRSPAGLDGLQVWLSTNGISAQNFSGGWLMDETSIGLLVIPVYDTALDQQRDAPSTKEEFLRQQDEYDLEMENISAKAERVPTLVVLPKWRSGMRLTGLAHPTLRVEEGRLASTLGQLIGDPDPQPVFASTPFTDFKYRSTEGEDLWATIYAAQMFKSPNCIPVIGNKDAMLLAECPLKETEDGNEDSILVLSDPDLLNNHGLRLGNNAYIALDVLGSRADERNLVIDYSRTSWLRDPFTEPERERTWADLLRFFEQPFLTLWFGSAVVFALFLWRASLRYGPVLSEPAAPGASKGLAVRARARLMRLSGQDGALTGEYAAARIAATAEALFGAANARHFTSEEDFLKYVKRRHPNRAARLENVLLDIRKLPEHLHAADAIHLIDELEQVLEQITHDA